MAHSHIHAKSSATKYGGTPDDYIEIHNWFDATKATYPKIPHRAIRHHSQGIFACEEVFSLKEENQQLRAQLAKVPPGIRECLGITEPDRTPMYVTRRSDGRQVPIRLIGEQHVKEDCGGRIPTPQDWLDGLAMASWMVLGARPLSEEMAALERAEAERAETERAVERGCTCGEAYDRRDADTPKCDYCRHGQAADGRAAVRSAV
jgi:hypothetical protein